MDPTKNENGALDGKTGWKMAVLKAAVQIIVALVGLGGLALGAWAQVKTGNTNDALKATVEQFNSRTIPMLETLLKEQRDDWKIRDKLTTACERLAYLEAFTKSLGDKAQVKPPGMGGGTFGYGVGVSHVMMGPLEPDKPDKAVAKPEDLIPRLNIQQLNQPK